MKVMGGEQISTRTIMLLLRYGGLLLVILWGLFASLVAAAEHFSQAWHLPGLLPMLTIVALEALITQGLVIRDRQRMDEQVTVRAAELVVLIALVRIWSLVTAEGTLLSHVTPWLREPLAFFADGFFGYFIWAALAWVIATLLARDVLVWSEAPDTIPPPESSIERDVLLNEWDEGIQRYRRRYIGVMVVTLTASAWALYEVPSMPPVKSQILPILASAAVVLAGLLLYSTGRLEQLRRSWSMDSIAIDSGIGRRWGRFATLLIIVLLIAAPLLGWLVLLAPPPPLVPLINALLVVLTVLASLVILFIGLLLSPLILLLSLLRGGSDAGAPSMPKIEAPQIAQTAGERPLLPALIFWGCVILLVIFALIRYGRGRSAILQSIARWRIVRWLMGLTTELWTDARGWATLVATRVRRLRRPSQHHHVQRPNTPHEQLRGLYRQMRRAGTRRGVLHRSSQTPYEYATQLGAALPIVESDVAGLTQTYVNAEYGPQPPGHPEVQRARRHWRRLQRWLLNDRTLRRRSK